MLKKRPLIPLTLLFISGIATGYYLDVAPLLWIAAATLLSMAVVATVWLAGRKSLPLSILPFFFLGILFIKPLVQPPSKMNIVNFADGSNKTVEAVVRALKGEDNRRLKVVVDARAVFEDRRWHPAKGGIILTVKEPPLLKKGDVVRFKTRLKEIRNFSNPGGFDYRWYMRRQQVFARGYVKEGGLVVVREAEEGLIDGFRRALLIELSRMGLENQGIIKALVLGYRYHIPQDTLDAFRKTSTAHLLAISGLHVGFVVYIFYGFFLWLLKRSERLMLALNVRKVALLLSFVPAFLYGALSGFQLSTVRALIMVGIFVLLFAMGRVRDLYSALSMAALLILLFSPDSLWDVGFQLSFMAVLAIIYLTPELCSKAYSDEPLTMRKKVWLFLAVTMAAMAGTYPILMYHFKTLSLSGVVANPLVVPVVGFVVIPLTLVATAVKPFSDTAAYLLYSGADGVLTPVVWFVKWLAEIPFSYIRTTKPTMVELGLVYGAVFSLPLLLRKKRRYVPVLFVAALLVVQGWWTLKAHTRDELRITFLSVGHGDAAVVELPAGKTMVIDGGGLYGFDTGRLISDFLRYRKITRIDYALLSHAQRDHMGGLKTVVEEFSPAEFWWNGTGSLDEGLKKVLEEEGTEIVIVDATSRARVIEGVRFEFLHPERAGAGSDVNEQSLVVLVEYGRRRFLFTGDIGKDTERRLLAKDIRADLLKVAHHGSKHSTTEEFLERVSPSLSVISADAYGRLPHGDTLKRLRAAGVRVFCTCTDGAVTVSTDGVSLDVKTYLTGKTL